MAKGRHEHGWCEVLARSSLLLTRLLYPISLQYTRVPHRQETYPFLALVLAQLNTFILPLVAAVVCWTSIKQAPERERVRVSDQTKILRCVTR